MLALIACNKNLPADGGSWTLHSTTYKATQAYYIFGGLSAYTGTNIPTGTLQLWFSDSTVTTRWPKHTSYTLTNSYPPDSGYAFMQITDSSLYNSWMITGSTTPSVTIAPYHDSLITITIPQVMVVNTNTTPVYFPQVIGKPTGTDSTPMFGTINRTY